MEKIGLIAGNRKFPILFAEAAKKKGYAVVAVAIRHDTCPGLKTYVDKLYWISLSEFSRLFQIFRSEGVVKVAMAGQISPQRLFSKEVAQSQELKNFLAAIKDKRADSVFGEIAKKLAASNFELIDSTTFLKDLLPKKGPLTRKEPVFGEWEDVYFGLDLAKQIAYLDIGQTVAVKDKAIVAVEALEGTDNLIRRAAKISRGGFSLVKVSKPRQDMRFDVPVVGLNTVRNLVRAKARCLAVEADKTIFIDREESINLADKKGLAIVAV